MIYICKNHINILLLILFNMTTNNEPIVISKETIKRLINDIKDLRKSPLNDEGIYYKHDESNMLIGYAYICGPKDSVYFGGNYFYKFEFPYDFPHTPPKVTFMNVDGTTRFHPNMYMNGKICLSILNTWRGEQWTGCQSIRTILLTILSILDDKPLLHEPGVTESHKDFDTYNKIIKYKNFEFSINEILLNKVTNILFYTDLFKDEIKSQFHKNIGELTTNINILRDVNSEPVKTGLYNLSTIINWKKVYSDFNSIKYKIDKGNK